MINIWRMGKRYWGIEIEIPEELSFEKSLENNRNMITCWILPEKCKSEKTESYYIEIVNGFFVGVKEEKIPVKDCL